MLKTLRQKTMTKKVLILDARIPIEEMEKRHIKSTSTLYKYYVGKKLLELGAKVDCRYAGASREPDWDAFFRGLEKYLKENGPYHSVISMAQRGYLSRGEVVGKRYYSLLKKYCKRVTTICDNAYYIGFADMTYYAVPMRPIDIKGADHKKFLDTRTKFVGWAADPTTCIYNKKPNDRKIRILIDHSYYGNRPYKESSEQIIHSAEKYLQQSHKNYDVIFKRFVSEKGIDTIKESGNYFEIFNRRKGLNHLDACKYYSESDIFVVTHAESMGLSVIESAMAGCLVMSPTHYIKSSLLKPLHHLEFSLKREIPWDKAIKMIDHKKAYTMAKEFNWSKVSSAIAEDLLK
jgi:hypothetical protein